MQIHSTRSNSLLLLISMLLNRTNSKVLLLFQNATWMSIRDLHYLLSNMTCVLIVLVGRKFVGDTLGYIQEMFWRRYKRRMCWKCLSHYVSLRKKYWICFKLSSIVSVTFCVCLCLSVYLKSVGAYCAYTYGGSYNPSSQSIKSS